MSHDHRAWRHLLTWACFCAMLFGSWNYDIHDASAAAGTFAYESAVNRCRGDVARPIAISDDQTVLCFDGEIMFDQDFSPVRKLKENGVFVIRSPGGSVEAAIALARLLNERHAIVVVHDYCFSACAAYLLIATDLTVVRKNSLVTWHHILSGFPDCFEMKSYDDGPTTVQSAPCPAVPEERLTRHRHAEELSLKYYRERTLYPSMFGTGFAAPQSLHVRRALKNMLDGTGAFPEVSWMWNPRYYKNVFKTNVTYEAYPESQAEADEIAARLGIRRVIYDP